MKDALQPMDKTFTETIAEIKNWQEYYRKLYVKTNDYKYFVKLREYGEKLESFRKELCVIAKVKDPTNVKLPAKTIVELKFHGFKIENKTNSPITFSRQGLEKLKTELQKQNVKTIDYGTGFIATKL